MGIKGLCQYLRKIEPNISVQVPIASFYGERIAVDVSVFLYKFICIDNKLQGNWIDLFINFITWLRLNNIRPVFIFDGPCPPQKHRTQKDRRTTRADSEAKVVEADDLLELINEHPINKDLPTKLIERIDELIKPGPRTKTDKPFVSAANLSRKEVLCAVNEQYKKYNSRCIHIRPQDIKAVQDLITFMGLPWYRAGGEAERTCAWLCRWGYVKGVLTTDSDVLAYGAPIFIQELRVNEEMCKIIRHEDVLEVLDMNDTQFVDFCIMCGTDYNDRIPGIGPAKAYRLLDDYNNLDNLVAENEPAKLLFHQDTRSLFTLPDKNNPQTIIDGCPENVEFKVRARTNPDMSGLLFFLLKHHSRYSPEQVVNTCYKPKFVIK